MTNFRGHKILDTDRDKVFWSKVNIKGSNDCWLWKMGKFKSGYGMFWNGNTTVKANRYAYESYNKCKIPKDKCILHHCDKKLCCNPKHLYCGTNQDNTDDMYNRGRGSNIRLSEDCVWEIRAMIDRGTSQRKIAECYQVSQKTISYIATGKTRKHVRY